MRTNPSPHDGEALLELSKANAALREQVVYLQEDRITALKQVASLTALTGALEAERDLEMDARAAAEAERDFWHYRWGVKQAKLAAAEAVIDAAERRIKGSHAMGCNAYGRTNFTANPPCDCGRDVLMLALAAYRAKETEE